MTPLHISNKQYEYFLNNFENLKHRKKYVNLYKNIYDGKRYMIRENYKETLDDKNQLIHISKMNGLSWKILIQVM